MVEEYTMQNVGLILLVFAFVFACIAAAFNITIGRWNFIGLALAFWIASELLGGLARVIH
jgi:hypothetical protein